MKLKFLFLLFICFSVLHVFAQSNSGFDKLYSYTGTINKKIPITLSLATKDSMVCGEIVYTKMNDHIPLRGTMVDGGNVLIYEFNKKGTITGIIYLKLSKNADNVIGTWTAPTTSDPLDVVLNKQATPAKNEWLPTDSKIGGTYEYAYSINGYQGSFTIKSIKDSVHYNCQSLTSAPARNLADAAGNAALKGRVAVCNNSDDGNTSCVFSIRFIWDIALISYINNQSDCGFGHNATVEGVYLKTSNMLKY